MITERARELNTRAREKEAELSRISRGSVIDPGLDRHPPAYAPTGWADNPKLTVTVSPSQISTYLDCPRKWGFEKIDGLRFGSAATELGTEVHAQRERWLMHGIPFDLTTKAGEIAMQGFDLLPPPGECVVEHEFRLWIQPRILEPNGHSWRTVDGGVMWHGFIDLIYEEGGSLCVDDHKTTSGRYPIKTEEDLRVDVQALIYSEVSMIEFGVDLVRNRWHFLRTTKPFRVEGTPTIFQRKEDPERIQAVELLKEISLEIAQVRRTRLPTVNDLPPNFLACGKYGGCKHMNECDRSTFDPITTHFTPPTY